MCCLARGKLSGCRDHHEQMKREGFTQAIMELETFPQNRRSFLQFCGAAAGAAFLGDQTGLSEAAGETTGASQPSHLVRFGPSDLYVTRYCQGTAFRSSEVQRSDNPRARAILHQCLDVGINFFDTAELYGWGGSEKVLGRVVAEARAREHVVLCTKATPNRPPKHHPNFSTFGKDDIPFSREILFRKLEGSLKRLETDYVDLYLLHAPDKVTPLEEIVQTMDALVRSGKVRYWGVSNHSAEQVAKLHEICQANPDTAPIVGTEDYYTITVAERFDPKLFRVIRNASLGLMAFSPQETGTLSPGREKQAGKTRMPVIRALDKVAREIGATRPQVCIAWSLAHPAVTSALGGAESPEHVVENFGGTQIELPKDALALLNAASVRYTERRLQRIEEEKKKAG